jgi:hypothetical protein
MNIKDIKFVELPNKYDIDELRLEIGEKNLSEYILKNSKVLTDLDIAFNQ